MSRHRRNQRARLLVVVLLLAFIAGAAVLEWRAARMSPDASPSTGERPVAARRETRPTLAPALFTGKAAQAYQVAREIPEVLDQLQCYCACTSQYGHVSLLSCYVDGHGST